MLPWQHLLSGYLQSLQGYEKQRTHSNICKFNKQNKNVAMTRLVARCCRKANQLQSVQGYGKQRTHKNIHEFKKQKKVLSVIVFKLISSNSCRGLECKKPTKNIFKPNKLENVLPRQYLLSDIAKKVITHKFSCHETLILAETHKQLPPNKK